MSKQISAAFIWEVHAGVSLCLRIIHLTQCMAQLQ